MAEFCESHKLTPAAQQAGGREAGQEERLDLKAAIRDTSWMLQNFYPHLLVFHGLLRWVVLAAAVAAIFVALSGWSGTKPASTNLGRFSIIFVVAMDIEFLSGLLLYFGASPITRAALANIGEALKYHEPRFFAVEHTALMFLAVI
ncbi:MAG TPA: hypothetical protein DHU55_02965, partial [Blastocatellia bacterium]|nr:hypothetical protein [Blastocatellia bacterium]